jgi:repressor LexA
MSVFSERLAALRRQRGLSQEGLGDAVDMEQSEISRYERGKREPSKEALMAFADFFGVSLDHLIGREEQSQPALPPWAREFQAAGAEIYAAGPEVKIPLYEEAAAGSPVFANEHPIGLEKVPSEAVADDLLHYILVKVCGDSMRDVGILPGSRVLVHRQPIVEDYQIALVRFVDTGDVTIKKIHYINGDQVQLIPANPSCPMEEKRREEIVIIGVVKEVYTKFM